MLWPHERPDLLPAHVSGRSVTQEVGVNLRLLAAGIFKKPTRRVQRDMYVVHNGSTGADVLPNKFRFSQLVRSMGYSAPETVFIPRRSTCAEVEQQVAGAFANGEQVFCKPLDAAHGLGAGLQENISSAMDVVTNRARPYLLQSYEPPVADLRIAIHRDVKELLHPEQGVVWRIAYQKVRPTVTGDGKSTVKELVSKSQDIPRYAKWVWHLSPWGGKCSPNDVPKQGEKVTIIDTGNISKGAFGRMIRDKQQLRNLDRFSTQFFTELEERIGARLATLCVDVGTKDPETLDGKYDEAKMRDQITFYEFQVPFAYAGYIGDMPKLSGKIGLVRTWIQQFNVLKGFAFSRWNSGFEMNNPGSLVNRLTA